MDKLKKEYEKPQLTTVAFKTELGYASSGDGIFGGFMSLGNSWGHDGGNAWDGSTSGGNGGNFGSGWTDNGSSAWE